MTKNEKEQVVLEAVQLLIKNKGLKIKVNRMWVDNIYFNVELYCVIRGEEKYERFGFVAKWFDPNDFELSWVKDLQIPKSANEYQKVLLKIAYYFYKWYNKENA